MPKTAATLRETLRPNARVTTRSETFLAACVGVAAFCWLKQHWAHRLPARETAVQNFPEGDVPSIHVYHSADAQSALLSGGLIEPPTLVPTC